MTIECLRCDWLVEVEAGPHVDPAALHAEHACPHSTVDGVVWCDLLDEIVPTDRPHLERANTRAAVNCPGPHRALVVGREVTP